MGRLVSKSEVMCLGNEVCKGWMGGACGRSIESLLLTIASLPRMSRV